MRSHCGRGEVVQENGEKVVAGIVTKKLVGNNIGEDDGNENYLWEKENVVTGD
jgi:hypothetical protein